IVGAVLFTAGCALAFLADLSRPNANGSLSWLSTGLALALVAAILLYDGWLKRFWPGPIVMGACRVLNVLLGMSAAGTFGWPLGAHLALVVGLYIVGVTWFARTEARTSKKALLMGAAGVMLAALLLALTVSLHVSPGTGSPLFVYLLVLLGFAVGLPIAGAL